MNDKRHPSKVHADEQGKSIILDSASTFYAQLLASTSEALPLSHRYDMLRNVFAHAVAQGTMECQIAFVGFFSKVDYCIKEYDIPFRIAAMIHLARKEMFPEWNRKRETQEEVLQRDFAHNLKATAYLVHYLFGREEIPASLSRHFPKADRKQSWGRYDENVLRIVVDHWDENYIWGTEEENGLTLQVCYGPENSILSRDGKGDWSYLQQVLWKGAQLNLVRIRHQEEAEEICFPELIILEPLERLGTSACLP